MSEEQNIGDPSPNYPSEPPKRRRVPSQYASQIADFKNVTLLPFRTTPLPQKKIEAKNKSNLLCHFPLNQKATRLNPCPASCLLVRN